MAGIPDKQIAVGPFAASMFLWASTVPTFVSAVLFTVAYAAVGWGYVESDGNIRRIEGKYSRYIGLWQTCHSKLGCRYLSTTEITAAARAAQTFATMSLLTIMIALLLTFANICVPHVRRERALAIMLAGAHGVSVLFVMITLSIFGARWRDSFRSNHYKTWISYSMAMAIFSLFMELIAAGLTALEVLAVMRKGANPPPQQQQPQQQVAAPSRQGQGQGQAGFSDMRAPARDYDYDNPTYQDPHKQY